MQFPYILYDTVRYDALFNCSLIRHDCSMNYDGGTHFRSPAHFNDYLKFSAEIAYFCTGLESSWQGSNTATRRFLKKIACRKFMSNQMIKMWLHYKIVKQSASQEIFIFEFCCLRKKNT